MDVIEPCLQLFETCSALDVSMINHSYCGNTHMSSEERRAALAELGLPLRDLSGELKCRLLPKKDFKHPWWHLAMPEVGVELGCELGVGGESG